VHDPVVNAAEAREEYGLELATWEALQPGQALVLAVAHNQLVGRPIEDLIAKVSAGGCVVDIKSKLDAAAIRRAGLEIWRL
jgi:UDP-N-acetyl-D-galactosamine dehydrogenase